MAMLDLNAGRFSDACTRLIRAIEFQKKALALNPKHPVFRRFLGNHYRLYFIASKGLVDAERWSEAATFGRQLIDLESDDAMVWLRVAPLLVLDGDLNAYAEFCERILERFDRTKDATVADKVCKACLLKPESTDVASLPRDVLVGAIDDGTAPDWFPPWGWGTRALLAYRSGDAESAIEFAQESEQHEPDLFAHAFNLAVMAVAKDQLGDQGAAEDDLDELSEIIERDNSRFDNYHDLLIARILFAEAQAKINRR
jgi:tetratricopeptide (TPR) repeat protein